MSRSTTPYSFTFYGTNLDPEKTTLFQDVKTRQAMAYAIDRQSIVDNIQLGFAEVAQGSQPVSRSPTLPIRSRPTTTSIRRKPSSS